MYGVHQYLRLAARLSKKKTLVTAHLQGYVGDALALYHGGLEAVGGELLHIGVPRGHVNLQTICGA